MKKLRTAIIGCGGMARAHAAALRAFGEFALVAAADPAAEARAAMQATAADIKCYEDAKQLLERETPDLVVVATPAPFHAECSIAALRAGAHVLCEKPIAVTLAEADRMLAAARETDRMLLVDHQFRISPRTQAALRLVRDGAIGAVRSLRCAAKGRYGGWELVESGTHLFDIAMLFAGAPRWVSSDIWVKDRPATVADIVDSRMVGRLPSGPVVGERVQVLVGFANGVLLQAEFLDVKSNLFVQVQGTKGAVHVPVGAASALPFISPKSYADPNDAEAQWRPIPVDWGKWGQQHNVFTYDLWAQWLADPQARPLAVDGMHPLDAAHGCRALEIVHGAFESHFQDGHRVALPLEQRDHPLERRWKKTKDPI